MLRLAVVLAAAAVPLAAAAEPAPTQLRVGSAPYQLDAHGSTLWSGMFDSGTLVRIDAHRGRIVRRYSVGGGPGEIAVSRGVAWIGNYVGDTIIRVDLARRRVRRIHVGEKPIAVDAGGGAVWVADLADHRVTKLSERTGKVLLRRTFPETHEALTVQPDGVWTASEQGIVHRLDPRSGRTLATTKVGDDADYIVAAAGSIWVSCYLDDRVWRLDPATGRVLRTFEVGTGAQGMAVAAGSLWVANYDTARLLRIDLSTGKVAGSIRVGQRPRAVVAVADGIWVADSGGSTLTRVPLG